MASAESPLVGVIMGSKSDWIYVRGSRGHERTQSSA